MTNQKQHYTGLSDAQVLESRAKHGKNILTPPKKDSLLKLFLSKFEDRLARNYYITGPRGETKKILQVTDR